MTLEKKIAKAWRERYEIAPYFFGRNFTNVKFFANMGTTPQTVVVDSTLYTVMAHSGLIVAK